MNKRERDSAYARIKKEILAYLSSGLRVVSVKIPVVVHSRVGHMLHYYSEQTPEALAEAIRAVDVSAPYDSKDFINGLDREFMAELQSILEQEES